MHIEHIIGDDEVPTGKQVNTELEKKTEEVSKLPKIQSIESRIQSIESRIQSIESGAGTNLINSGLQKEWRVPKKCFIGQRHWSSSERVSTRRSLNQFCEHMAFVS